MSLCARCSSISLSALTQDLSDRCGGQKGMFLLENGTDLADSALKCSLCALIQETLFRNFESASTGTCDEPRTLSLSPDALVLEPKADPIGLAFPEPPTEGSSYLTGFNVIATEETGIQLRGKVRLYTDGQTRNLVHGRDVVGRPKLSHAAGDSAFSLLRRWIDACKHGHASCKQTLAGHIVDETSPPVLPTRVLHLQGDSVRLLQSESRHGRYVTLSHCWGPPDKQPLRTTQANLQKHLEEIAWSEIPKTFQDAITVVRNIGLQYIWIDSLCIVQDDQDDWLRQSRQMGSIYERAELTIAASHAADPWEGFLLPRPPPPSSVELLGFFPQRPAGSSPRVFATIRRGAATDTFPEFGALNRRAWVTQEWLLSRRMVFYTRSVVIWSCKAITQSETGEKCYSISRNARWKNVVEQYSERQLTFATDKLIALEGLRTEMGRRHGHEYVYGVWKEGLPDQLLWQPTQRVEGEEIVDPLGLPTWTWTHVPCGVKFLGIKGAKNLCESIVCSQDLKQMTVRARARRISATVPSLEAGRDDPVMMTAIRADVRTSHAKLTSSMAQYILDQTGSVVGWLVLDRRAEDIAKGSVSCLALMGGAGRRAEELERRTGMVVSAKLRPYWVLIVRHWGGEAYTRIGIGKTYGREWWRDAAVEAFTLL